MLASLPVPPYEAFLLLYFLAAWLPPYSLICYCRGWPPSRRSLGWLGGLMFLTAAAWDNELQSAYFDHSWLYGGVRSSSLPWWGVSYYRDVFLRAAGILTLSGGITILYLFLRRPDLYHQRIRKRSDS